LVSRLGTSDFIFAAQACCLIRPLVATSAPSSHPFSGHQTEQHMNAISMKSTVACRHVAGMLTSAALLLPAAAMAQISGAIYTSLGNGTVVNMNIYPAKADVYLNGGPQNQNAAGLPNGIYYFQVTSPNNILLSQDPAACRQLMVQGGVVAGAVPGLINPDDGTGCSHANGTTNGANGSTPVRLIPYADTPNNGGEYKVWLIQSAAATISATDNRALVFGNRFAKTDNFKVDEAEECVPPLNEPCEPGEGDPPFTIGGHKFYDGNVNSVFDVGEVGIAGYQIELFGAAASNTTTVLSPLGMYSFLGLDPGSYGTCEVIPAGGQTWLTTTGTTISPINIGPDSTDNDFGNVCLGGGNGRTLGFWSNRNGESRIKSAGTTAVLSSLSALNLRSANGNDFDPSDYKAFRTWLLNATATNMAYMLSAQMSAMSLNVSVGGTSGPVPANAQLYAGTAPTGCSVTGLSPLGFIGAQALIDAANASLGADGLTLSGDPNRVCQEFLKDALDDGNNNLNFVQTDPTQCLVEYSGEELACSPAP